ncbi:MAG: hypothetical protein AAFX06_27030 [Planctomycetota bacterium]
MNSRAQAIVLFLIAPVGLLGLVAQIETGNVPLAILFGTLTPAAVTLGVWLWKRQ